MTQAINDNFIFCQKCGQQNGENNFKCTRCGFALHAPVRTQYIVTDDSSMGGLIPYRNPKSLWAYYLGIFSLVPFLGILLSVPAIIFGITGLRYANLNPQAKGKVHAWVGIVLGSLCAAGYTLILVSAVIAGSSK